jgi:hypothetical protein
MKRKLDWSELPEPIRYLIPYAEEYGIYEQDSDALEAIDRLTREERTRLAALGEKILRDNHYLSQVSPWLRKHPITEHEAACRLYFLFLFLDYIGIAFDE